MAVSVQSYSSCTSVAVCYFASCDVLKLCDVEMMCIHFDRSAVSSASDRLPPHLNVSCTVLNSSVFVFCV